MKCRTLALIFGIVAAVAIFAVAGVAAIVLSVISIMDRTPAHVCALAIVAHSPAAVRLVGSPTAQKGFTGGRSNETNGELYERITFNVTGPRGDAFVLSEGSRSPLGSTPGPFDCPQLHERR